MSHHIGLQVLRAKLRGFQAAGMTITSRISTSEKERKNKLWDEKRRLGWFARHHFVAYGLLRGVPYISIERCGMFNKIRPELLLSIMLEHAEKEQKRWLTLESVGELLIAVPAGTSRGQTLRTVPCVTSTFSSDHRHQPSVKLQFEGPRDLAEKSVTGR